MKKIAIIGAGPGGLSAGLLLSARGYEVDIYEKEEEVGGRNAEIRLGDFRFDTGPTFLMLPRIIEELFAGAGKKIEDYLELTYLDPLYDLVFDDMQMTMTTDREKMRAEIAEKFPGNETGYDEFWRRESKRYEKIFPLLQKRYLSPFDLIDRRVVAAAPHAALTRSLMDVLEDYFDDEKLRVAFTFQAKYLGMSPWECPGLFAILPYIEHNYGVYHVKGGLNRISHAMADVITENGGRIHYGTPVKQIAVENGAATGLELEGGQMVEADKVVLNADFSYAVNHLFPEGSLKKWAPEKLEDKTYSCSGFLLYLGVDKQFPDKAHHTITFSKDYRKYVDDITNNAGEITDDLSFYIQNAGVTDDTLAPEGKSGIYILVPIQNNRAGIDWSTEAPRIRDLVLRLAEEKAGFEGLRESIVEEKMITPDQWESEYNVYKGAIFNLGHHLSQMMHMRPKNRFDEVQNVYIVGGGTHPGSGLPTIYESGRISSDAICEDDGNPQPEPQSLDELW